jgi:cytochrome c biogenesis protein CcmG/thiol:disulfide interchange protein DsbE
MAPQISGSDLRTGAKVTLSTLRGHYVLVNFFASWCVPCVQEAPDLITFEYNQQHGGGGANLLSVVFHDQTSSARQFLRTQGATWRAVSDPGGRIAEEYGVSDPPTTYLVDPSGRVSVNPIIGPATKANLEALLHSDQKATAHG